MIAGGLFDEALSSRRELIRPFQELPESVIAQLAPALGNRRHATPIVPALERDPSGRQARWQGDAEAPIAAAFGTSTIPERGRRTARDQPTFMRAPLSPDRMDVPRIPEAGLVVAKGSVR